MLNEISWNAQCPNIHRPTLILTKIKQLSKSSGADTIIHINTSWTKHTPNYIAVDKVYVLSKLLCHLCWALRHRTCLMAIKCHNKWASFSLTNRITTIHQSCISILYTLIKFEWISWQKFITNVATHLFFH